MTACFKIKVLIIVGTITLLEIYAPEFTVGFVMVLIGFSVDKNRSKILKLEERIDNLLGKEEEEEEEV